MICDNSTLIHNNRDCCPRAGWAFVVRNSRLTIHAQVTARKIPAFAVDYQMSIHGCVPRDYFTCLLADNPSEGTDPSALCETEGFAQEIQLPIAAPAEAKHNRENEAGTLKTNFGTQF